MRSAKVLLPGAAVALLAGCSLAPEYYRAPMTTAPAYKELGPWQPAATTPPAAGTWWQLFGDPVLDNLEARIESANPDLAAAVARYQQATGLLTQAQSQLLPEMAVGGDAARSRVSAGRPLSSGSAETYNNLSVGASLAYELDLFGRIRNSIRANQANAQASNFDINAVRLGLQASLATAYFRMRGLDARTALLRQTVEAFQRAFDLTNTRHLGGISSGIDVSRAEAQLASARSELGAVAAQRAAFEHAVAVLVGENPSTFSLPLSALQTPPPMIPAGVPSTLLERRPDITAAERRVAAANARVGVARAALFPSITLGGSGGYQATHGDIFQAPNSFWALGPLSVSLPIFDGGRRRAGVRIARAEYDELAANYRSTVLVAFREVEDNLAASRNLVTQIQDQGQAARAANRTRELALIRYRDGAADYLDVVTAQTAALDAERALLDLRTQQLVTATDTVRALGGIY